MDVGKLIDNCPRGMKCLSVDLSYNNWQAVSKFCENLHNLPKSTEILILNFGYGSRRPQFIQLFWLNGPEPIGHLVGGGAANQLT